VIVAGWAPGAFMPQANLFSEDAGFRFSYVFSVSPESVFAARTLLLEEIRRQSEVYAIITAAARLIKGQVQTAGARTRKANFLRSTGRRFVFSEGRRVVTADGLGVKPSVSRKSATV
jgi:hypothetical protein